MTLVEIGWARRAISAVDWGTRRSSLKVARFRYSARNGGKGSVRASAPVGSELRAGRSDAQTQETNTDKQEVGRWANNRVENSHLPFRRRKRAVLRFRQMKSLQKFASIHANVQNHFDLDRLLTDRQTYKTARSAALAERQNLMA